MFDFYKIDPFIINMNQKKNSNSMSDYIYTKIDTEIIKIIEEIQSKILLMSIFLYFRNHQKPKKFEFELITKNSRFKKQIIVIL